jgi:biopolymer transport protein ExbD
VKVDLPGEPPRAQVLPTKNKVVVTTAGAILWNGAPISLGGLRATLAFTSQMDPTPELHLQPEPDARYELVDQVLAVTKQARVEKMGFVGNERYANF